MKSSTQVMQPGRLSRLLIPLMFASLALSSTAQAVSPPPDGGYPNGNTAEGENALLNLTTGGFNTAVGLYSLASDTTANFNTAIGAGTLVFNTADQNTATGVGALLSNTIGADNTANGALALVNSATGGANTAIGALALFSNTSAGANTAIGHSALGNSTTGGANTALGFFAGSSVTTANNVIAIGAFVSGQNANNSCYIGNIWDQPGGTQAVYVNSDGKLGYQVSSQRFKDDIKPINQASEIIYGLKPVTFRYRKEIEPTRPLGFGLIAEEVEKIRPDLVTRGRDGKASAVRYDAVNVMLLNEFIKEHKRVEELESTVASLAATVREQAGQIQKLVTEVDMSEATPKVVLNP